MYSDKPLAKMHLMFQLLKFISVLSDFLGLLQFPPVLRLSRHWCSGVEFCFPPCWAHHVSLPLPGGWEGDGHQTSHQNLLPTQSSAPSSSCAQRLLISCLFVSRMKGESVVSILCTRDRREGERISGKGGMVFFFCL